MGIVTFLPPDHLNRDAFHKGIALMPFSDLADLSSSSHQFCVANWGRFSHYIDRLFSVESFDSQTAHQIVGICRSPGVNCHIPIYYGLFGLADGRSSSLHISVYFAITYDYLVPRLSIYPISSEAGPEVENFAAREFYI